jgi:hypothetical protein
MGMEIFLAGTITALITVFIVDVSRKRRAFLNGQKMRRF